MYLIYYTKASIMRVREFINNEVPQKTKHSLMLVDIIKNNTPFSLLGTDIFNIINDQEFVDTVNYEANANPDKGSAEYIVQYAKQHYPDLFRPSDRDDEYGEDSEGRLSPLGHDIG